MSRQNGELKRTGLSALVALVVAAVPSLTATSAWAEAASGGAAQDEQGKADKHDKGHPKHVKKARTPVTSKGQAPHGKREAKVDESGKTDSKVDSKADKADKADKAEAKHATTSTASHGKKAKKVAARAPTTRARRAGKKADKEAPPRPCLGAQVTVDRGGLEGEPLAPLDCHSKPRESARERLSLLARPWSVGRPRSLEKASSAQSAAGTKAKSAPARRESGKAPFEVAPGIRLLDPGLLTRLDAIARRFPGRPVSLVSGYRPQSRGSQHQSGRALDLRVSGVRNEELVAFCKTLADTGCGYYPNSSFVHVDVRNPGTGSVTWIDASGPGEAPRYVRQWPPPAGEATDKPASSDKPAAADAEPHDGTKDPWQIDPDAGDPPRPAPSKGEDPEVDDPKGTFGSTNAPDTTEAPDLDEDSNRS
jgi:Bacterial protein of unknown function (DUF882)